MYNNLGGTFNYGVHCCVLKNITCTAYYVLYKQACTLVTSKPSYVASSVVVLFNVQLSSNYLFNTCNSYH